MNKVIMAARTDGYVPTPNATSKHCSKRRRRCSSPRAWMPRCERSRRRPASASGRSTAISRNAPDLIVSVFRREVDACADAAPVLATKYEPGEALALWIYRYVDFLSAKRGLAAALHSGDTAYNALPAYFKERLLPTFQALLEAAAAAGEVRGGVEPYGLLWSIASLCTSGQDVGPDHARRMVDLLIDGPSLWCDRAVATWASVVLSHRTRCPNHLRGCFRWSADRMARTNRMIADGEPSRGF